MIANKNVRLVIGGGFWAVVVLAALFWMIRSGSEGAASGSAVLLRSFASAPADYRIIDPTGWVETNDVVFGRAADDSNQWREVGYVSAVRDNGQADAENELVVTVFEPGLWNDSAKLKVHRCTGRVDEILSTLLPEDRRQALQDRLATAMEAHLAEVTDAVLPLVMQSLQASVPVIEQGMVDSIVEHRQEIDRLADRYRTEIVRERLVPLVREEVIPIVREHGQGPAEEIGREIWSKASLWRFGWRAIYDKSPLPERELVQEEWQRFVEREVVPTMEDHLDEIAAAVELMLRDLVRNDRLRDEMVAVVGTIATDEEARNLFRVILSEAVIDNQALHRVWADVWSSPDANRRLRIAGQRIEPILRQIGDEVMGTREGGIEPGFARVLRNQILGKDRTWITVGSEIGLSSAAEGPRLEKAEEFMAYPVVHLANPDF